MSGSKVPFVAGAALIAVSVAIYALDARRAGQRDVQIDHVLKNARQITTIDVPPLDKGELVIASDVPLPVTPVSDPDLEITIDGLQLSRQVWIYQWRESEETVGERTTYSYSKRWVGSPISSAFFHDPRYRNHGGLPFRDHTVKAGGYTFGDLKLDKSFGSSLPSSRKLEVTRDMFDSMPSYFRQRFALVNGELHPNRDPQIGDIKVAFTYVPSRQSTVVGAFNEGAIVPAKTEAGEIAILREGNLSLEELAAQEKASSASLGLFLKILAGVLGAGGAGGIALGFHFMRTQPNSRGSL